jgi:tetratricopeptide (TPR) repeat protein
MWPVRAWLLCCGALLSGSVCVSADSRETLQKAALLVQQGRLEEADRQTQLALSDPDGRAVACSILGVIRFQQKRLPESVEYLREAIRLEPRLLGAHLTLAQVYTVQKKPALALDLYGRVLALDPSNATARIALARSEIEKGNHQGALDLAGPVLPAFKQSPEGLLILAAASLKTGDHAAASELAGDWARLPGVPRDWSIEFALLLAKEGAPQASVDVLERTKATVPTSFELEFNLAGAYLLNKDPARALETYDVALALKPDSIPALRQAAGIAEHRGELERSLSYWMRAKKIEPENPEILLGFGRVCLKMDLLDDAEPALTKAAGLKPDEPAYQYTLAAAKVGKRQYESAQTLLEPMVTKHPQDPHFQYALGAVLYVQGRLDEAAARLKESVRLQPEQLASHYYLALVARDQGNDAEAIQILEALLQRHPDHWASCEVLGGLLMAAQRYPEAEANLRTAVRLNPESVKANYQLGLLLARMGRKEEADKQLALTKTLRQEDEATSRLQLRLLDPE